jgi:hypothetical protein
MQLDCALQQERCSNRLFGSIPQAPGDPGFPGSPNCSGQYPKELNHAYDRCCSRDDRCLECQRSCGGSQASEGGEHRSRHRQGRCLLHGGAERIPSCGDRIWRRHNAAGSHGCSTFARPDSEPLGTGPREQAREHDLVHETRRRGQSGAIVYCRLRQSSAAASTTRRGLLHRDWVRSRPDPPARSRSSARPTVVAKPSACLCGRGLLRLHLFCTFMSGPGSQVTPRSSLSECEPISPPPCGEGCAPKNPQFPAFSTRPSLQPYQEFDSPSLRHV